MPRFLNTHTGEFEWHPDPMKVTYAILSHVWRMPEEGGEQTYDDVRRIQQEVEADRRVHSSLRVGSDRAAVSDTSTATSWAPFASVELGHIMNDECGTIFSHRGLSSKIKRFCKVAREAGFRLVWNDACCIDKSSSAELSEALNSMYEWYRLSDMCYVYLVDVPDGDVPQKDSSDFRWSKWHRRGWTLQELIAPERILFLTESWNFLGTKMGLARTLERIIGVDFDILVGRATVDSVSVARRMSWAARRETTRVEDRAYSLLGIFGLHMSPMYGEGENAFLRLQEEIIRSVPDQSTFAWGGCLSTLRLSDEGEWSMQRERWLHGDKHYGLLASSPTSFSECSDIEPIDSSSLTQALRIPENQVPPVHCIFTPEGVTMRLICLPLSGVPDISEAFQEPQFARNICEECRQLGEFNTLVLLQCQAGCKTGTTSILGLPLCRSRREGGGSNHTLNIGCHFHYPINNVFHRTVHIEMGELVEVLKHVRPKVEEVTLLRHYSHPSVPKSLQQRSTAASYWPGSPFSGYLNNISFEISPHSMDALETLGIVPSPLQVTRSEEEIILETTLAFRGNSRMGTTDTIALRLSFRSRVHSEVEACFFVGGVGFIGSVSSQSSSAGNSRHAVVNTPHISGGFLDMNSNNDSCTIIPLGIWDTWGRTIVSTEYTLHSEGMWGVSARLLRIALQHTFASRHMEDLPSSHLWLSIDISEEHQYSLWMESGLNSSSSEQTGTDVCERDTSNEHDNLFPSCQSTGLSVNTEDGDRRYAMRESIDTLQAQIAGLSSQHSSQMQDMDRKMSVVLARLGDSASSQCRQIFLSLSAILAFLWLTRHITQV
ncbi:Vegetative incompatibility protein HET-E-1 [Trametes pubescens]|uniref:Vegetative incompatibility protein HET-E-1 n=1 Tax=Trametes pubescens TaxID=154538 RepID=A0A1M2VKV0_TRAPU|nr:Vegetative incompatibility protein HET-E-1 [Trametes pubescens]